VFLSFPVASSTQHRSVDWQGWVYVLLCGYNIAVLWSVIHLVSLFRTVLPNRPSWSDIDVTLRWHWCDTEVTEGACRPRWFFYVRNWGVSNICLSLTWSRSATDTILTVDSHVLYQIQYLSGPDFLIQSAGIPGRSDNPYISSLSRCCE